MKEGMREIELLAPAKDLETGRQAILHGADAVYIGGPAFGARQAAGNSLEDIRALCDFARPYGVKVYVTLNTIIYEDELQDVQRLVLQLHECGVSALITQDLALLRMNVPMPLHASTQMDNRTPAKARILQQLGYQQIVLARELSLQEISDIHSAVPDMPLEAFVHGALCVSYSGRCQASEHCFHRSANRGQCAQFCRLAFDLVDEEGKILHPGRNFLSLRDMNRYTSVEKMLDAGISSLKIEGRLKDIAYVKNITAYYRQLLDQIIARRPEYKRSSRGEHRFSFQPNPLRSFNRGFTEYFLHGRQGDEHSIFTPKSQGQPIGTALRHSHTEDIHEDYAMDIQLLPGITLANGDGLCYFDADHRLHGFRINRAVGSRIFFSASSATHVPAEGTPLYRNQDIAFDSALSHPTAERKLPLDIVLTDDLLQQTYDLARTPQEDNIRRQMSRLGDTPYYLRSLDIRFSQNWFIPSSHLATIRRRLVEEASKATAPIQQVPFTPSANAPATIQTGEEEASFIIANSMAKSVAQEHGLATFPAAELTHNAHELMRCRYCLRHALGQCLKEGHKARPWFLRLPDGRTFPLKFDCSRCEMSVLSS